MLSTKGQYKHLEPKSGESERFPALWRFVPARGKRCLTSRVATILPLCLSTAAATKLHYVPQHCNCSSMDLVRVYCITSALYVEHCRMFGKRAKDRKSTDKNVALVECSCNAGELHCKGFEEGGRVVIAASCPSQVSVLCPGLIL